VTVNAEDLFNQIEAIEDSIPAPLPPSVNPHNGAEYTTSVLGRVFDNALAAQTRAICLLARVLVLDLQARSDA
jgi:hypothetical protein